ncbi:hypothetical protein GTY81_06780 [Streptomyces sp. SID8366]|uniref:hypothetical protein n=2 Tax=Streptomyces TaxID=1883 RepID=UPI000DB9907C|nr:hypothetical protein [Streptomyces sp. PsTaAH-130]MYU03606.1 hypothetical protein [Streptomyces sp. SID8366]RAJ57666.1 hypothetical protein K376_03689 [Streptomyces sp. PsTaAH-130]
MSGLVVVRLHSPGGEASGAAPWAGAVLRVRMGTAGSSAEVIAEAGHVRAGTGALPEGDEHCAVNAEAAPENRRLACADVLYGTRPRPSASAARWLTRLAARHPSCALAAVPLAQGGWLALAGPAGRGRGGGPLVVAAAIGPDQPLLASCLHAWLVEGRPLAELAYVRPLRQVAAGGRTAAGACAHSRRRASAGLVTS